MDVPPLPHVIVMNKNLFLQRFEVFKTKNNHHLGEVENTMPFSENFKFCSVLICRFVNIRTSSILSNLCWVSIFLDILFSFQLQ